MVERINPIATPKMLSSEYKPIPSTIAVLMYVCLCALSVAKTFSLSPDVQKALAGKT